MRKVNSVDSDLGLSSKMEEYENLFGIKLKGLFGKGKRSANQMYASEMEQRKEAGKKSMSFKDWLERAQKFGLVDKIMGKDPTESTESTEGEDEKSEATDSKDKGADDSKPNKILGLPPAVAYIGGAAAIGLTIWGIVEIVKAARRKKA